MTPSSLGFRLQISPRVVETGVVVPAVEPERRELAIPIAIASGGDGVLFRVSVEDVLGADRQRDPIAEREASLEIDERFASVQGVRV